MYDEIQVKITKRDGKLEKYICDNVDLTFSDLLIELSLNDPYNDVRIYIPIDTISSIEISQKYDTEDEDE